MTTTLQGTISPASRLRDFAARTPNAVALRKNTGVKESSAIGLRSFSTSTLHLAYAVMGAVTDSSLLSSSRSPPLAPYTLHEEAYTNLSTPACLAISARRTVARWLILNVSSGSSSPTGSLERSARWMTASNPSSWWGSVSRVSRRVHRGAASTPS